VRLGLAFIAVFGLALAAPAARATGVGDATSEARPRRVTEGALLFRFAGQETPTPAPVLKTEVDIRVTGVAVRTVVRQEFANPARDWAEGVYVFPLPEDAAVDHMRMRVGDRSIEGVVQERGEAKRTYEQAKQQGRRASLVEQERPNIFTTSVANIPPGAAVSVEIEYQHVLAFDQGQLRLRFPMVIGPRYVPGAPLSPAGTADGGLGWAGDTDQVTDASRITPPVQHPARGPLNPVNLRIELAPGVPLSGLEAPYHQIQATTLGHDTYRITLAAGPVPADRDFELVWQPAATAVPVASAFTATRGDDVFALLMVLPPAPGATERARSTREVVFVIDTSGSMHGASIEQARAALKLALGRLQAADTFNVIQFNSRTNSLFATPQPASLPNLRLAERYVDALKAEGGTEMLPALARALDGREHPDRLRQVIFLTDGAVGNEAQLFTTMEGRLGDSRLFTIGIGSAPNGHFMREAARLGRGTFTYIGSTTEVQQKMDVLFRKLESPALTDVQLELSGGVQAETFPSRIPDVYLGEPVIVTLRADARPARAVLRGRLGGASWEQEVWLRDAPEEAGLPVHWARAKIAALLDQRRAGTAADEVRRAVVEVALRHHLVSPHTSLVAVDVTPGRPGDAALQTHALRTNLPLGWDYTAVFGLGQGATAGSVHVALGLVALLLAVALEGLALVSRARAGRRSRAS
jgi:Ca-activated chloride channel homolog